MINRLFTKNIRQFLFNSILILFFSYDFIVKVIVAYTDFKLLYNYVIVFKVIIISLLITNFDFKKIRAKYLAPITILTASYIITQLSAYQFLKLEDINFNGYYFLSSIISILFFIYLEYKQQELDKERVVNGFLLFMMINSVCVIIGYLFEIQVFESYFRGNRFGYSGMLLYHHEIGYLFFIAIILAYHKIKKRTTVFNCIGFFLIFFSSFLFGTKKTIFFTLFFVIFLIIQNLKNYKALITYSSIVVLVGLFFHKTLNSIYNTYYDLFYNIYVNDGFWSSFLSYRNDLLFEKFTPYLSDEMNLQTLLFGFPIFNNHRTELEFFDLLLFFGVLGFVSYFLYFKLLLNGKNKTSYFLVLSLLFGSLFSGNLLASVNAMVLLVITLKYINPKNNLYENY
ncbi:hypothetical protein [Winogradskyella sp. A3E31]|uniref:hypothetical protein n=1 Tax=Winogradskyella sp. A3E31 TaxID=3349637 RepID=UPI00398A9EBC